MAAVLDVGATMPCLLAVVAEFGGVRCLVRGGKVSMEWIIASIFRRCPCQELLHVFEVPSLALPLPDSLRGVVVLESVPKGGLYTPGLSAMSRCQAKETTNRSLRSSFTWGDRLPSLLTATMQSSPVG